MKKMKKKITWKKLYSSVWKYKKEVIRANLVIIFMSILILPIPMIIPYAINTLFTPKNSSETALLMKNTLIGDDFSLSSQLIVLYLIAVLLRLIVVILNKYQYAIFANVSGKIGTLIRQYLLVQIHKIQFNEIRRLDGKNLATKLLLDVDVISSFICNFLGRISVAVITIILSFIVMMNIHSSLAFGILFLYPVVIIYWTKIAMQFTEVKKKEKEAQENFSKTLTSVFCQIDTVRTTANDNWLFNKLKTQAKVLSNKSIKSLYHSHNSIQNSSLILNLGVDIFQFTVILVALSTSLSLGEVLTIYAYLWLIQSPIMELIQLKNAFYSSKSSLERINIVFNTLIEPQGDTKYFTYPNDAPFDILIKNVSFSHNLSQPILKNINLTIREGEFIGISGPSGCGKSTLASLLVGLNYPDSGQILYSGEPVQNIGVEKLRKSVALILQDTYIFDYSLRENLVSDKSITDIEIMSILELCQLGHFVRNQKDGLNTIIGLQGVVLSGGQRQRLAIARALLLNPKVLILDETTSALDLLTEKKLITAIMPLLRVRTVIVISHRNEMLKLANKLYLLEEGLLSHVTTSKTQDPMKKINSYDALQYRQ